MHADNWRYAAIKNGVCIVAGTGPAIRIDAGRLVIRDGPLETPPLRLTRAKARRQLRHVIVSGNAGGYVSVDALRWLHDAGVAFSVLDWNAAVIASSASPDLPALRRAQVLVCCGAVPGAAAAITREILRVKLAGQARVAKMLASAAGITRAQSAAASATIAGYAAAITRETDIARMLMAEAHAAAFYWELWKDVPIAFARRNPKRLGPGARWLPGRHDPWLVFGPRASLLTGQPYRATTPGNCVLNFLYAVCQTELTIALRTSGIDPGIGLFHVDMPNRPSLTLDGIEALRPYVDLWLFSYLADSVFANRDFNELHDGEVRLTHPLSSHLAMTAALWRQLCEPVAEWLKNSFMRAAETSLAHTRRWLSPAAPARDPMPQRAAHAGAGKLRAVGTLPERETTSPPRSRRARHLPALAPLLPALISSTRPDLSARKGFARLRDEPVPRTCRECGREMLGNQRVFCSRKCAVDNVQARRRSSAKALPRPE
jgi:CRISPR-associated endonuclease Cas1